MGRNAGWLTLHAGIASGSDIILIPEIPYDLDVICNTCIQRSGRALSDAVLFAVLLRQPMEEVSQDADDPGAAIDDLLHPLVERLVLPRKIRDRMRQSMLVQRKFQVPPHGRQAALASRDFFAEALDLYEVGLRAAGAGPDGTLEAWRAAQNLTGTGDVQRPRARRRGGRRRRAPRARADLGS
jgi:hypothetical protein